MIRFIANVWVFLSVLAAMGLVLSYTSVYVNPSTFWILGLMGLAYPVLLLINLMFLVYWIFRWRPEALIPTMAMAMGMGHFASFFQLPFGGATCTKQETVKVLSYNVHFFQLFAWAEKPPTHKNIFNFISSESPDFFSIQEFYTAKGLLSEKEFRAQFPKHHAHIHYIVKRKESAYGLATLSKFPVVETGEIKFEKSANACIYTDVLYKNDTLRIYNIHFQSLKLKDRNLRFLSDPQYRKGSQKMEEIKDLSFRYRDAVIKRSQQVAQVAQHIEKCRHPVIVCGDFNELPISFSYRSMRKNLRDAFVDAGRGVGHTYRGLLPFMRIDFILFSPPFRACSYGSPSKNYSDHNPVITQLVFEKTNPPLAIYPK